MHSGIWEDVIEALVDDYRVTYLDLPGYGYSRSTVSDHSLESLSRIIAAVAPPKPSGSAGHSADDRPAAGQRRAGAGSQLVLVSSSPVSCVGPIGPMRWTTGYCTPSPRT